jgi:N-methylhydantoinase B
MPAVPDVEANERVAPLRYLHRRLSQDSGGPGEHRGGLGAETAFTVAGVEGVDALIMTHGAEVPNSTGQFGGLPGAQIRQRMGRGVLPDGAFPQGGRPYDAAELGGTWEEFGPKPGMMPMTRRDVFDVSWQGGGGIGDPLERDPEAVWRDVRDGLVSRVAADAVYGVVGDADGGTPDAAGTQARRDALRAERLDGASAPDVASRPSGEGAERWPVGAALELVRADGAWHLCTDGATLATGTTAWRDAAVSRPLPAVPGARPLHPELTMTAHYCPRTGRLLAVDVHRRDEEPVDDVVLDLDSVAALL